jgi:hypothetical protein
VFCDESGTRSAFLQWGVRGAVLLVLLLCAGLVLTLDTQVRLPGLSRLLPSSDIGFGRPKGPARVAVPDDPKARPTVAVDHPLATDPDDPQLPGTDKPSATTSPTTAARKAVANTPPMSIPTPAATVPPAARPRTRATAPAATPPASDPTRGQRQPPGQAKKTTPPSARPSARPPSAQPTGPADARARGNGQGNNGLAKGKAEKPEVPPVPGAAPTIP